MEISEKIENGITILTPVGKIDVNSSKIFQGKFSVISKRGDKNIIIDCANISYASSSGLRVFLMFLKHTGKTKGKLVMCGMNEIIYEVFDISGFLPIFNIKENLQEALQEF